MSLATLTERILSISKFINVLPLKEVPPFTERTLISCRQLDDGPKSEIERKSASLWVDLVTPESAKEWIHQETLTDAYYVIKQTPRIQSMAEWKPASIQIWLK